MSEWLIERGIGETRAVLVDDGAIIEARILVDGSVPAGSVLAARLTDPGLNGRNALALDEGGIEYLLPRGAGRTNHGASVRIEVTREAIPGLEPWKRPLARITDEPVGEASPLRGRAVTFPAPADELSGSGWNELVDEARSNIVSFSGGELRISPTAAMTLIDVDGYLAADELAVRGAAAAARAIRRLDIGGSIGIDLPTVGNKAARQAAAAAVDAALPQPFERTAVNGFGFVQIVRPRLRPSLVELAQDHASFEGRSLLRSAALGLPGGKRLIVHSAVRDFIGAHAGWLETLGRQLGGNVELRAEPSLPMSGGYAENL